MMEKWERPTCTKEVFWEQSCEDAKNVIQDKFHSFLMKIKVQCEGLTKGLENADTYSEWESVFGKKIDSIGSITSEVVEKMNESDNIADFWGFVQNDILAFAEEYLAEFREVVAAQISQSKELKSAVKKCFGGMFSSGENKKPELVKMVVDGWASKYLRVNVIMNFAPINIWEKENINENGKLLSVFLRENIDFTKAELAKELKKLDDESKLVEQAA